MDIRVHVSDSNQYNTIYNRNYNQHYQQQNALYNVRECYTAIEPPLRAGGRRHRE